MSVALEFDNEPHQDLLNWPTPNLDKPAKKAILITNSSHPLAIGDAIAAMPAIFAQTKWAVDCGAFSAIIFSCPQMINLFDLGIPQWHISLRFPLKVLFASGLVLHRIVEHRF